MEETSTTTENTQATNINAGVEEKTAEAAVELFNGNELVFGIINTHSATLSAQITDNFVENNFAIHDHIAFSPITVTLSGLVGNLILKSEAATQQAQDELEQAKNRQRLSGNFFAPTNYTDALIYTDSSALFATKLGAIEEIFPPMSNVTRMATGSIQYAYEAASAVLSSKWANQNDAVLNNTPITKSGEPDELQKAYEQIKNTFYGRQPSKVYTPWAVYENMYIQTVEISQDEHNHIIDLSVTFKQIKWAQVESGKVNEEVRASYNAAAAADVENGGKGRLQSTFYRWGDAASRKFYQTGLDELKGMGGY